MNNNFFHGVHWIPLNPCGIPAASKEPATGHGDPERLGCYNATQQPEVRVEGNY